MPGAIEVRKVPIPSVADASELTKLIDEGVIAADRVFAIIGKTEGNGGVNDYTRIIADRAFDLAMVVYSYVDEVDWETWFSHYGIRFTSELHYRMHWYAIAQTVLTLYGEQNGIARAEGLTVLRELLDEAEERTQ